MNNYRNLANVIPKELFEALHAEARQLAEISDSNSSFREKREEINIHSEEIFLVISPDTCMCGCDKFANVEIYEGKESVKKALEQGHRVFKFPLPGMIEITKAEVNLIEKST